MKYQAGWHCGVFEIKDHTDSYHSYILTSIGSTVVFFAVWCYKCFLCQSALPAIFSEIPVADVTLKRICEVARASDIGIFHVPHIHHLRSCWILICKSALMEVPWTFCFVPDSLRKTACMIRNLIKCACCFGLTPTLPKIISGWGWTSQIFNAEHGHSCWLQHPHFKCSTEAGFGILLEDLQQDF